MVLRVFALGVWRGRHSYLADGYNRLDVIIIATSWCGIMLWQTCHPEGSHVFSGKCAPWVLCFLNLGLQQIRTYCERVFWLARVLVVMMVSVTCRAFKVLHWAGVYQPFRPAIFRAFRAILCLRNIEAFTAIIVRPFLLPCTVWGKNANRKYRPLMQLAGYHDLLLLRRITAGPVYCGERRSAVQQLIHGHSVNASARAQDGVCTPQAIIEAVGVAIPQLSSVISLFMILFIIFCLSGVSLFSGSFHRRCVLPTGPDPSDYVYSYTPWFCGNQNAITHKTKVRAIAVPLCAQ